MAMLTFYQRRGPGSSHYFVPPKPPVLSAERWGAVRDLAIRLMSARGQQAAAVFLRDNDFQIQKGENDFKDDFDVLYRKVSFDEYVQFNAPGFLQGFTGPCSQIAQTLGELGHHIRFVSVEYEPDVSPQPVVSPTPKITSITVETALHDAEQTVAQKRPVSAVDRAHTALHGYLKESCSEASIQLQSQNPTLTELSKALIKQHPKLANLGPHKDQIEKILKAMSVTCDALNSIRNHGSLAHANEALIEPAEAMLAINASRTLLHYIDQKLQ